MEMKLYRVHLYLSWSFVLAENEEQARALELIRVDDPNGEFDDYSDMKIIEYPLDKPMILPAHWQSEDKRTW